MHVHHSSIYRLIRLVCNGLQKLIDSYEPSAQFNIKWVAFFKLEIIGLLSDIIDMVFGFSKLTRPLFFINIILKVFLYLAINAVFGFI